MNFKEYLAANLNEGSPYDGVKSPKRDNAPLGPAPIDGKPKSSVKPEDREPRSEHDAANWLSGNGPKTDADREREEIRAKLAAPSSDAVRRRQRAREDAFNRAKRSETFVSRILRKIGIKD